METLSAKLIKEVVHINNILNRENQQLKEEVRYFDKKSTRLMYKIEELEKENGELKNKVLELYNELIQKNETLKKETNTNIYLSRIIKELKEK